MKSSSDSCEPESTEYDDTSKDDTTTQSYDDFRRLRDRTDLQLCLAKNLMKPKPWGCR